MRNAGLGEAQAGIKTDGRNINNLRYADDTTLMGESEEELKSLLRKVKVESEKAGLKLNIQKTKIMAGLLQRFLGRPDKAPHGEHQVPRAPGWVLHPTLPEADSVGA